MTNEAKGIGKGLLVGIFTGAAIGSIIALLYAPKSGNKLREEIKTKAQDITDDTEKYIRNFKKKVSQIFNDVKKKSEFLITETEEDVNVIVNEPEKLLVDAKDKIENSVYTGKGLLKKEHGRFKSAMKAGMNAYKADKDD